MDSSRLAPLSTRPEGGSNLEPALRSDRMPPGRRLGWMPAIGLVAVGLLAACAGEPEEGAEAGEGMPPPPVTLEELSREDVQVDGEYAGRVRGSREVEVRARVEGILEKRRYTEGQLVESGESLFRIDREPYEIALQQAEAERQDAEANLNQAQREWQRISGLYERDAVSESERDQTLANRELAEAHMAMADAAVRDARRNLRYTDVPAPVEGATGLESFSEGTLVERGTLLTTVTQHDPAHVRFALPEDDAEIQRLARRAMADRELGPDEQDAHRHEATLIRPTGEEHDQPGVVDFTDSTVNPATGSVTARAVFENPERHLVPGQFVRVRLLLEELEDVILIPESAVGQGDDAPRVFIVDDDGVAHARPVELGPVVNGRQVILDGLETGEQLVVNGHVALDDGMPVDPQDGEEGDQ